MKKRTFTPNEKANIVLEALRGERTIAQIASTYDAHPNVIGQWKKTAQEGLVSLFADKRKKEAKSEEDTDRLYALIGRREAEIAFLKKVSRPT